MAPDTTQNVNLVARVQQLESERLQHIQDTQFMLGEISIRKWLVMRCSQAAIDALLGDLSSFIMLVSLEATFLLSLIIALIVVFH